MPKPMANLESKSPTKLGNCWSEKDEMKYFLRVMNISDTSNLRCHVTSDGFSELSECGRV